MSEDMVSWDDVMTDDADVIYVAYGVSARVCLGAVDVLRRGGVRAGMIRPKTLFPFPSKRLRRASRFAKRVIVVELSNGQMAEDVERVVEDCTPVLRYNWMGGVVPSVREVVERTKRDI
jgi:pyruvate/2-oxoacid:ferredoxin oxidoreductase alpha subunit